MTHLQVAEALTLGSEKARREGRAVASLAMALVAAEFLRAARSIEAMNDAAKHTPTDRAGDADGH